MWPTNLCTLCSEGGSDAMNDGIVTSCVYTVKLVRFLVLWIALYVTEKVFQDAYVSSVLIRNSTPPDLRPLVIYALLVDFVFFTFMVFVIQLLRAQDRGATYAIDGNLVASLVLDYIGSVVVFGVVGLGISSVVQDKEILRYKDDGLRSIRALGTLLLYGALITLTVPYYMLLV